MSHNKLQNTNSADLLHAKRVSIDEEHELRMKYLKVEDEKKMETMEAEVAASNAKKAYYQAKKEKLNPSQSQGPHLVGNTDLSYIYSA